MPDLKPAVAFLLGAGCVLWVGYTTPLFQHDAQIQDASLSTKTPVCPKPKGRDAHVTCGPCDAAGQRATGASAGKDLDYKTSLRSLLVARLPDSCKSGNALQDEPDLPLPESLLQCHLDTPETKKQVQACRGNAIDTTANRRQEAAVFKYKVKQYMDAGGDPGFQHNHGYLGKDSVVIEIGGNKGVFAHKLTSAYNIGAMHIIEPVTPMVEKLKKRFAGVLNAKGAPAAHIHKWAVGPEQTQLRMAYRSSTDAAAKFLMGDETIESLGWTGATVETVEVKTFPQAWVAMGVEMVDLININIEGAEFHVVDALLASGIQMKIKNIQVQFHVHAGIELSDKAGKRCRFREILKLSHEQVYNFDWVWEQWRLKE